ncbi:DUF4097 family beta strand repeat-containing protein [Streptomyces sp. NPDC020379]|uniref:DUF4097 family beta strand repeat-containing protein n=1 Tax=Streptomyces sp. NPDC020379 TaxID=3365071 RepID=UPI003798A897
MARRLVPLVVLSCAAAAVLTAGCSVIDGPTKRAERTYTLDGEVKVVDAATNGGSITVVPMEGSGPARVTEKYEYSSQEPDPRHSLKDGRFTLERDDCGGSDHRCTVNVEVLVPRTAAVDLRTSGGNITVRGTSGEIAAHTSGGDVIIEDSAARKATARTSGGNVTATFTRVPDSVDGRTQGGDVRIHVPRDSYAVEASTQGGTRKVTVPTDDRSAHGIKAHTQGGDVTVSPS